MAWLNERWSKIGKTEKITVLATFLAGLIIHLFMFTNKLPNPDDLGQFYDAMYRPGYGRWFLSVPSLFTGKLSIPFKGFLGVAYISIGAGFAVSAFRIRNTLCAVMIGLLMVSFPSVASTFTYMNGSDSYFFALMLCCIAVYLTVKKNNVGRIASVILLILSLSIYQSYFAFAAALLVSVNIYSFLDGEKTNRELIFNGLKDMAILVCALIGYLISVKCYNAVFGVNLTDYQNISSMGSVSLSDLPRLIVEAYRHSLGFFLSNEKLVNSRFFNYAFAAMWVLAVFCLYYALIRSDCEQKGFRAIWIGILLALLPLAVGFVYLVNASSVHMVMVYGFVFYLIFPLTAVDKFLCTEGQGVLRNICGLATVAALCSAVLNYSVLSNQVYLTLSLAYEQSYAFSNRLITRIESQSGFSKTDSIVFIGRPVIDTEETTMPWKKDEKRLASMTGVVDQFVRLGSYPNFLRIYMGIEYDVNVWGSLSDLEGTEYYEQVKNASCYPDDGSIIVGDGVVYVNFQEHDN